MSWRHYLTVAVDAVRERDVSLSRRQLWTLVLVALVIGTAGIPAAGVLADYLSDPVEQSGDVTYTAASGPAVTVTGSYNFSGSQLWPDNNTVRYVSDQGNITASSPARTHVTVEQIEGTWTNLTAVDASNATLTLDPDDKQAVKITGNASEFDFRQATVDDGTVEFAIQTTDSPDVTITEAPGSTGMVLVDQETGVIVDDSTSTSSGEVTFSLSGEDGQYLVRTADSSQGAPEITNVQPSGALSEPPSQISANISDNDFPSDEVTVELSLNGDVVKTTTITNDSRVTADIGGLEGGDHTVTVEATDIYDQTTTYQSSFSTPASLTVFNASAPTEAVANASLTVYADDEVYSRDTDENGSTTLEGLPAEQRLVVEASADGYLDRRVVIQSLSAQQSVYLLPENETTVETEFVIDDRTGQFSPEDTVIYVEAAITRNNVTEWEVVASDYAGTAGFTTYLVEGDRYRIFVRNSDGDSRSLGSYTASRPRTVTLTIGDIQLGGGGGDQGVIADGELNSEDDSSSGEIKFSYRDLNDQTDELRFHVEDENGTVVYPEATVTNPGTVTETIPVDEADKNYEIVWEADRGNETVSGTERVGGVTPLFGGEQHLDGRILELMGWVGIVAFAGFLVLIDSSFAAIGVVFIAAILRVLGVVNDIPMLAITLAGTAAVMLYFGRR